MRDLFLIFLAFTTLTSALPIESPAEESIAAGNPPTKSDASASAEVKPPTVLFKESEHEPRNYWVILQADSGYKSSPWPGPKMYGSKDTESMSQIKDSIVTTLKESGLGARILPVYFENGRSAILLSNQSPIQTSADKHGWHLSIPVNEKAFWKESKPYPFGTDPTKFRTIIWPKLQEGFPEIILPEDELSKIEEHVTAKEEKYRSSSGKKKRPQQSSRN